MHFRTLPCIRALAATLIGAVIVSACGATIVRPEPEAAPDWRKLKVKVQTPAGTDPIFLQNEVSRTGLFADVSRSEGDTSPDLVISNIDEHSVGKVTGPFCLDYALAYLSIGIFPEICDQQYSVVVTVTAPATGRAAVLNGEFTQRRFIGFAGVVASMFDGWHFFGPSPSDPALARAALLSQRGEIDGLMK